MSQDRTPQIDAFDSEAEVLERLEAVPNPAYDERRRMIVHRLSLAGDGA